MSVKGMLLSDRKVFAKCEFREHSEVNKVTYTMRKNVQYNSITELTCTLPEPSLQTHMYTPPKASPNKPTKKKAL